MPPLVRKTLHVKTGQSNASHVERNAPSLSDCQNNSGKNHNVLDKMPHTIPKQKGKLCPSVCSSYLNKIPGSYTLVSNRRKLLVPWTPGTVYERVPSNPIPGRRHACACQEQNLHVEITVQHHVFFKTLLKKSEGFFVNSSVLVTDVYVPVQPSKTMHSAGRTGGTQPTLRYCLHLKLDTCKVHVVMVPFRRTASGEQIPGAEEIKDTLMTYIIKGET